MDQSFESGMLRSVKKHLLVILVVALACGAALGFYKKWRYVARYSTQVILMVREPDKRDLPFDRVQSEKALTGFYAELAASQAVCRRAQADLAGKGMALEEDFVRSALEVKKGEHSVTLRVESTDEKQTLALAAAYDRSLVALGEEIRGVNCLVEVETPDQAELVQAFSFVKYALAGFLGGFLVAAFLAYMKDRWFTAERGA